MMIQIKRNSLEYSNQIKIYNCKLKTLNPILIEKTDGFTLIPKPESMNYLDWLNFQYSIGCLNV